MRVTDYELFAVPPRWLFLKLETSTGLVGWGEPIVQLGIDVDESYVREQSRADVKWYNPVWRHEDGGIAEW